MFHRLLHYLDNNCLDYLAHALITDFGTFALTRAELLSSLIHTYKYVVARGLKSIYSA